MPEEISRTGWTQGDDTDAARTEAAVLDEVFGRLYDRIRRLAQRIRWNNSNPTLNATALVNEAYIRLRKDPPDLAMKSYEDVIAILANAMRQILIDAARRKGAQKRIVATMPERADLQLEDAITACAVLDKLKKDNPRNGQIVECRFLLGMTVPETAKALRVSTKTVERGWQEAKVQLAGKLEPSKQDS
jgi:RNA polymerase sigma factor (TIGR02999 family)